MKTYRTVAISAATALAAAGGAAAQSAAYRAHPLPPGAEREIVYTDDAAHDMAWTTVDCGGGLLAGDGALQIEGTVGQSDAGELSAGPLAMAGGYWSIVVTPATCYANCDASTTPPLLNVLDFNCFLNHFAASDGYANCDGSTIPPALNVLDFNCFLNRFSNGCP